MNLKRAWKTRPVLWRASGSCSSPWNAFWSGVDERVWEWQVWFDQEIVGHMYDVEYISNGVPLGADYQMSRANAMEAARSFSYADSWAFLAAKVYGPEGEVIYDSIVRQPTAQELREHAAVYASMDHMGLEYTALMEYAERLEKEASDGQQEGA
jgi:hypothetical protein